MNKRLDLFLVVGCACTYLAANRAEELAARQNIALHWGQYRVRSIMIEH